LADLVADICIYLPGASGKTSSPSAFVTAIHTENDFYLKERDTLKRNLDPKSLHEKVASGSWG
jgi:hypothetical protein